MLKAAKGNRVVRIPEEKAAEYKQLGYMISDLSGRVIYEPENTKKKMEALSAENAELKTKMEALSAENTELKAKIEALSAENAELRTKVEDLETATKPANIKKTPKSDEDK